MKNIFLILVFHLNLFAVAKNPMFFKTGDKATRTPPKPCAKAGSSCGVISRDTTAFNPLCASFAIHPDYISQILDCRYQIFDLSMRYYQYKKHVYTDTDIQFKNDRLKLYKRIYQKNNFLNVIPSLDQKIPTIIHQIWLGGPLPSKFKRIALQWRFMHPNWIFVLWTDQNIKKLFPLYNQELFNKAKSLAEKADILRYEILLRHGGVYVDTDYECIKSFEPLVCRYQFFAGIEPTDTSSLHIGNAIIGAAVNHPIIKNCVQTLKSASNEIDIYKRTGPAFFTKCFYNIAQFYDEELIALPVSYLYPLGFFEKDSYKLYEVLAPETFGIHYWEGSWRQ